MSIGQSLGIQGVLLGSFILAAFGWIVSANAAPLPPTPSSSKNILDIQTGDQSGEADAILPPMLERLNNPEDGSTITDPLETSQEEDIFDASVAFTPEIDTVEDSGGEITGEAGCRVSNTFPDSILQWCELITRYADHHGLSPDLIASVMLQESGGQHLAYSHSGAVGLMQVMPRDGIAEKFMCKNGPCFSSRPTISELEDPDFNVSYGTRMLAGLNTRFGNIRDALKSYGPMDVGYSYADKVLAIYERYKN